VIATYSWEMGGPGFKIKNVGNLKTKITASDPQYYGGDGSFDFVLTHSDPTCQLTSRHKVATHITARQSYNAEKQADQLELTFSIKPPTGSVAQTCPNSFLLANAAFTDPAAPWNGTAISFPLSGDTKPLTLHGSNPGIPAAQVTITVQPILEGAGK
jgi:hypothetical protein